MSRRRDAIGAPHLGLAARLGAGIPAGIVLSSHALGAADRHVRWLVIEQCPSL